MISKRNNKMIVCVFQRQDYTESVMRLLSEFQQNILNNGDEGYYFYVRDDFMTDTVTIELHKGRQYA